jgi:hypothetical protein
VQSHDLQLIKYVFDCNSLNWSSGLVWFWCDYILSASQLGPCVICGVCLFCAA